MSSGGTERARAVAAIASAPAHAGSQPRRRAYTAGERERRLSTRSALRRLDHSRNGVREAGGHMCRTVHATRS